MFSFLLYVDSDLAYWYMTVFEKLALETGGWIWDTPFAICVWGWGFHKKPVFFLNIFSAEPHVDALIIGLY